MASTYLTRTESAGNRKIGTISVWVKKSSLGNQYIYSNWNTSTSGYQSSLIQFTSSDRLEIVNYQTSGGAHSNITTNRLFRDVNAWYHIVINWDTTQTTSSNRYKMYVNGVQETSFSTATYPSLNEDLYFNIGGSSNPLAIGSLHSTGGSAFFNGSMSHYHNIDGTAYNASTFGETDATTGIWKPKTAPSVTYGTNGFFLKFENSAAMGTDSSGNSNTFSVNGTMTQLIDTPSNVFATWNSLDNINASTMSNVNTKITTVTGNYSPNTSTLRATLGKWYWEVKLAQHTSSGANESDMIGIGNNSVQSATTNPSSIGINYRGNGRVWNYGGTSETPVGNYASFSSGDIIMVALDLSDSTTGKLYFGKNGTWGNSGNPVTGANSYDFTKGTEAWGAMVTCYSSGSSAIFEANFGQGYFSTTAVSSAQNPDDGIGIFEYDVPAGYRAWCTKSINAEEYS